jgi:uncharacterized protein DUF4054
VGIDACVATPQTPGIVTFDPAAFIAAYPSFTTVPAAALTANFTFATLLLNNTCCSAVKDAPTRAVLLNLLVAHITALLNGVNGQPPQGVVGRISAATEGSVSVTVEFQTQSEAAAYFQQTQWGAMYWRATAQYRTARYFPPCETEGFFPWNVWPQ